MTERTGGCQCGKVRYRLSGEPLNLAVCHCKECQRQSGSAFGMSMLVPQANLAVEGELKSYERSSESGRPVRCFFCPECGTRVYHVVTWAQGTLTLKPGTLDDTSWLSPRVHSWTKFKQPWVEIPEGMPQHATQPM